MDIEDIISATKGHEGQYCTIFTSNPSPFVGGDVYHGYFNGIDEQSGGFSMIDGEKKEYRISQISKIIWEDENK